MDRIFHWRLQVCGKHQVAVQILFVAYNKHPRGTLSPFLFGCRRMNHTFISSFFSNSHQKQSPEKKLKFWNWSLFEVFFWDFVFGCFCKDLQKSWGTKRIFSDKSENPEFWGQKFCCWEGFATKIVVWRERQAFTCVWKKRLVQVHVFARVVFTHHFCFPSKQGFTWFPVGQSLVTAFGEISEKEGVERKMPVLPQVSGEDSNQSWFYEVKCTCVLPPK